MTSTRYAAILIAVLGTAMVGCGCNDGKVTELENANRMLTGENRELTDKLAQCSQRQSELDSELMTAQADLAQASRERDEALQAARAAQEAVVGMGPTAPGWVATPAGDMITVGSDILFPSGKADLTSEGQSRLSRAAQDIRSTYSERSLRVVGHTDSDPIRRTQNLWKDNLDLSANRAMAVTRYLVSQGVPLERIETVGMADSRPVASNSSADGKAKNRRVEILAIH